MMNNGGGGNTGYFRRGKKKEEKENQKLWDDTDKFELSTQDDEDTFECDDDKKSGFGHRLLDKMKRYLK